MQQTLNATIRGELTHQMSLHLLDLYFDSAKSLAEQFALLHDHVHHSRIFSDDAHALVDEEE